MLGEEKLNESGEPRPEDEETWETDDPTASLIDKSTEESVDDKTGNDKIDWSECMILTLDMLNSFSLLLGVLLVASGL